MLYIMQNNGIRTDAGAIPNRYRTEYMCACADDHIVTQCRVPFDAALQRGTARVTPW